MNEQRQFERAIGDVFSREFQSWLADCIGWASYDGGLNPAFRPAEKAETLFISWLLNERIEQGAAR